MKRLLRPIAWLLIASVSFWIGGCAVTIENFADYPQQVQVGTAPIYTYVQQPGYYAVHYAAMPELLPERVTSDAVAVMEEEAIAVFAGSPTARKAATNGIVTPVYALKSGGSIAVPTGQVFIRFAEAIPTASRQDAIQTAGYKIVEIPEYAPHTAWVRSRSGKVAEALEGLSRLSAIADVEHIEPQMLTQRQFK
jgi:hypothetical protein